MKPTAKELIEAAKRGKQIAERQLKEYEDEDHDDPDMLDIILGHLACFDHILATVRPDDGEPVNDHAIQVDGWFCRDGVWLHPDNQSIAVVIVDNGAAMSIGSVARGVELRVKSMGHIRRLVAALGE